MGLLSGCIPEGTSTPASQPWLPGVWSSLFTSLTLPVRSKGSQLHCLSASRCGSLEQTLSWRFMCRGSIGRSGAREAGPGRQGNRAAMQMKRAAAHPTGAARAGMAL